MLKKLRKDNNTMVLSVVFVITLFALAIGIGPKFFTVNNFQSMGFQVSEFGFLALAMSLAMISGGIDLSIIANAGVSGIVAAYIMSGKIIEITDENHFKLVLIAVISALIVSTFCGFINGCLIAKLSVPPILATLGTMIFYTGIGMALTNGQSVRIGVREFSRFSTLTIFKIPIIFLILLITVIVISVILSKSSYGRKLYLTGQNKVAADFSGINPEMTLIITYTLSGFFVGISSLIIISRVNSARMGFGDTYQLQAILVAVLGGIDPDGGKGNVIGVALGIIVIQFLQSAFTIMQFTPYAKKLLWGVLLIVVMFLRNKLENGDFNIIKRFKLIRREG